jgi:hypothetical protein
MTSYEQFSQIGAAKLVEALEGGEEHSALTAHFIRACALLIGQQQGRILELESDLYGAKSEIDRLQRELFWSEI